MIAHHVRRLCGIYNLRRTSISSVAAAHSSWFRLDDQGMKEFELLARGSGFYVRGPNSGVLIAVVSAHVAAPHRFPAYFSNEWLRHVRDADCRTVLEMRSEDGKLITDSVATQSLSAGFRHASLDVAAFLLDETSLPQNAKTNILELDPNDTVEPGMEVIVCGHRLIGESGSGAEAVLAAEIEGKVSELTKGRGFINTEDIDTEMGMCGGPIISTKNRGLCVGILEGLVPRLSEGEKAVAEIQKRVAGHSVFISARELRMFLHDVETEAARGKQTVKSGAK